LLKLLYFSICTKDWRILWTDKTAALRCIVVVCSLFNDAFSESQTIYSVDFYSILIRLPSSSEAGETRVRNMSAEFCRRAPIVLVGFFNMP
jgi:hypothetical protein